MGAAVDRLFLKLTQVKGYTRTQHGHLVQVHPYSSRRDKHGNGYITVPKHIPGVTVTTHRMTPVFRKQLREEDESGGRNWFKLKAFYTDTPNGNYVMLARDKTGKILGAAEYYHYHGDAYVHSLHVNQSLHRKNVGSHLMQQIAAETVARPKGHLRKMYVVGALLSAEPFYERLGGTSLEPHQVKALADGKPTTEEGGGTHMGTYAEREKVWYDTINGDITERRPENAHKWRAA